MEHRNSIFEHQDVLLDGDVFTGCTFRNCRLIFKATAPVSLVGNQILDSQWIFDGPAALTINFMSALHRMGGGGRDLIERTISDTIRGSHRTTMPPAPVGGTSS